MRVKLVEIASGWILRRLIYVNGINQTVWYLRNLQILLLPLLSLELEVAPVATGLKKEEFRIWSSLSRWHPTVDFTFDVWFGTIRSCQFVRFLLRSKDYITEFKLNVITNVENIRSNLDVNPSKQFISVHHLMLMFWRIWDLCQPYLFVQFSWKTSRDTKTNWSTSEN